MNKQVYLECSKKIGIVKQDFFSSCKLTQKWSWNKKNDLLCFLLCCLVLLYHEVWSIDLVYGQSKTALGSNITKMDPSLQSLAIGIDFLCPEIPSDSTGATKDLGDRCSELVRNSGSGNFGTVNFGLEEMATKQTITQGTSSVETSYVPFTIIGARIANIRGLAKAHGDTTSLALSINGERFSAPLFASLNPETISKESMITEESNLLGGLGTFINGSINTGNKDESNREPGFDFDTKGLTTGADYRFTDKFFLGTAFNFSRVDADLQSSDDSVDIDSYNALIYGSYYLENLYIDGVAAYGWNDYDDIRRHIIYSIPSTSGGITIVNQLAKSDTDGEQYSLDFGAGYDFSIDEFTVGPYARINYTKIDIDKYTEKIAPNSRPGNGLALTIDDQDMRSLISILGAQATYSISTSWAVLVPQARCEWVHEYANDSRKVKARFVNDPTFTPFSFKTDKPDRDYVNLGVGLSAIFPRGLSSFLYYEPVVGLDDITSHHIVAGIRYEF